MPSTAQLEYVRISGEEPPHTCPMIDSALSDLERITDAVIISGVDRLDEDELRSSLEDVIRDVENNASDIVDGLERVRRNAEDLRAWGDAFQRLSDETLDELEPLQQFEEQMSTWRGTFRHVFNMARHQLRQKINAVTRPVKQRPGFVPV